MCEVTIVLDGADEIPHAAERLPADAFAGNFAETAFDLSQLGSDEMPFFV